MASPDYSIVCRELHTARGHLYAMVECLSLDELRWLPPRPDGVSVGYHFGHIAVVEDQSVSEAVGQARLSSIELQEACAATNANNRDARIPAGDVILETIQAVRARTIEVLALFFRGIRDERSAVNAAELFRRVINHEYSHTKYIRRICAEMGKPPVDPPASDVIHADTTAVAAPQYSIRNW